jgi:UBX domain-containing protein 2
MTDYLAPAEQEKLNEFQVITSFPEDQLDKVVRLLRNNYWNLEVALSKYFDGILDQEAERLPLIDPQDQQPVSLLREQALLPNDMDDLVQQMMNGTSTMFMPQLPIVRPISNRWKSNPGLNQPIDYLGLQTLRQSPFLFLLLLIPRSLTLLFTGVSYLLGLLFPASPDQIPQNPTRSEFSAVQYFKELTHDDCPYKLHKGDFNEVFEQAKQESKFILLILIGSNDRSTEFVKRALNNEQVSQYISSEDILVYMANVDEPQGFEIASSFKARATPSVYLMANVASGPNSISSMSLLSRVPSKSATSLFNKMKIEIEKYKPELISKRIEQEEIRYAREIRELQDKAYEESLIIDKIKQSQREEEERIKLQQEQEAQWRHTQRLKWFKNMYSVFQDPLDGLAKGEYTTIRFKLPHGVQITRRFSKEQSMTNVYSFVALQIHLEKISEAEIAEMGQYDGDDMDEQYIHDFGFELISPFPRFAVPLDDTKVQDVQQLWPNGSLLVEFNDDEENGSDEE